MELTWKLLLGCSLFWVVPEISLQPLVVLISLADIVIISSKLFILKVFLSKLLKREVPILRVSLICAIPLERLEM